MPTKKSAKKKSMISKKRTNSTVKKTRVVTSPVPAAIPFYSRFGTWGIIIAAVLFLSLGSIVAGYQGYGPLSAIFQSPSVNKIVLDDTEFRVVTQTKKDERNNTVTVTDKKTGKTTKNVKDTDVDKVVKNRSSKPTANVGGGSAKVASWLFPDSCADKYGIPGLVAVDGYTCGEGQRDFGSFDGKKCCGSVGQIQLGADEYCASQPYVDENGNSVSGENYVCKEESVCGNTVARVRRGVGVFTRTTNEKVKCVDAEVDNNNGFGNVNNVKVKTSGSVCCPN